VSDGYSRYALLRETPLNGAEVIVDLMTALTDLGGPERMRESHELIQSRTEDVNRRRRTRRDGLRYQVDMAISITTMNDQATVADIVNKWEDRGEEWSFELSMDGGINYIPVGLLNYTGPVPIRDKTVIGADYRMVWESLDLLYEVPFITASAAPAISSPVLPRVYEFPTNPSPGQVARIKLLNQPEQIAWWISDAADVFGWVVVATGGT
jgi:hypothetical protein